MHWGTLRQSISAEERLEQTRKTITSLLDAGIEDIYLADNSGEEWVAQTESYLRPSKVFVYNQHQFKNKGISEIYLLMTVLKHLPADTPVLKISGRYYLKNNLCFDLEGADLAAKFIPYSRTQQWMSTRCYLVKDKNIYEQFLKAVLRNLYGYQAKIVGPGSMLRILRNSLFPRLDDMPYDDPILPIEVVAAGVLKSSAYLVKKVDVLGIEGITGDQARQLLIE